MRFHFTLKDLFWAVTLLGLGIGSLVVFIEQIKSLNEHGIVWGVFLWEVFIKEARNRNEHGVIRRICVIFCGLVSFPMIGAGCYAIFANNIKGAKRRGASVVVAGMLVLFALGGMMAFIGSP